MWPSPRDPEGSLALIDPDHVAQRSRAVQESEEFRGLKRAFIGFIAPMTVAFLVWYLVYILLAGFAPGLFAVPVLGHITVGLLFGLAQVVTTFVITMMYRSWADRTYDPAAAALRAEMDGVDTGHAATAGEDRR